jgi:hypothetical protein
MRPPTQKRLGNPSPSPQASGSNVRIDTQMVPVEKSQSPGHGSSGLQGVDPDDLVLKEMQAIWAATQNLGLAVYLFSINGIRNLALGLNITDMSLTAVKNLLEVDGTFKDLLVLCATKGRCDDLKRLREHGNAHIIISFPTSSLM